MAAHTALVLRNRAIPGVAQGRHRREAAKRPDLFNVETAVPVGGHGRRLAAREKGVTR